MRPDSRLRIVRDHWDEIELPGHVLRFLAEADHRLADTPDLPEAFVPADYGLVYQALCQIERPRRFLEWGCGFGVVAGLAAGLGWHSAAIEQDPLLLEAATTLLADFGLPVDLQGGDLFTWPLEADLVYLYLWPNELPRCLEYFAEAARPGTRLLMYDGGEQLRLLETFDEKEMAKEEAPPTE